jgi:hypothetical protein
VPFPRLCRHPGHWGSRLGSEAKGCQPEPASQSLPIHLIVASWFYTYQKKLKQCLSLDTDLGTLPVHSRYSIKKKKKKHNRFDKWGDWVYFFVILYKGMAIYQIKISCLHLMYLYLDIFDIFKTLWPIFIKQP